MKVKKFSGELIDFDIEKFCTSLRNSGASHEETQAVWEYLQAQIYDGISTKELYQIAFRQLKVISNALAARYSLKKALRDLGPSGYFFEKWVAKFLQNLGYDILHSQLIKGKAVTHEADVIAHKADELIWIECKFRNTVDAKISVTTPMYLLSRVNDIMNKDYKLFNQTLQFTKGWLVTNAYLSADSIAFAEYYGITLLAWDYPSNKSIKSLVDQKALYPITCLTTLSNREKELLLQKNCMLVKELKEESSFLALLKINDPKKKKILREINELIYE